MKEIFSTVAFDLQPGERVGVRVRRGLALAVTGERVWLTRSNEAVDYFVHDGESLSLRPHETLWISVDGERATQLVFTLAAGTGSRVADWGVGVWQRLRAWTPRGVLGLRIG
ncbi:DUF2917 domain-containing protein [Pararobbsia silviterrae]|nr:DUF2917 domain-containing protein [Pararobbsia silviterrae]